MGRPTKEQSAAKKVAEQQSDILPTADVDSTAGATQTNSPEGEIEKKDDAQAAAENQPNVQDSMEPQSSQVQTESISLNQQQPDETFADEGLPGSVIKTGIIESGDQKDYFDLTKPVQLEGVEHLDAAKDPENTINIYGTDFNIDEESQMLVEHGVIQVTDGGNINVLIDEDQFKRFLSSLSPENNDYAVKFVSLGAAEIEGLNETIDEMQDYYNELVKAAEKGGIDINSLSSAFSGLLSQFDKVKSGKPYVDGDLKPCFNTYKEVADAVEEQIDLYNQTHEEEPVYHGDHLNESLIGRDDIKITYDWDQVTAPEHLPLKPKE